MAASIRTFDDWTQLSVDNKIADGTTVNVLFNGLRLEYKYDAGASDTVNSTSTGPGTVVNGQGGVGRWLLQYSGEVNVLWWGALDSSSASAGEQTANVNAFQTAINLGEPVFVPRGTYQVDSGISVSGIDGFSMRGDGKFSFDGSTIELRTNDLDLLKLDNCDYFHLSNISLRGLKDATGTGNTRGLVLDNSCNRGKLEDVYSRGFDTGFDLNGFLNRYEKIFADVCGVGMRMSEVNGTTMEVIVENCRESLYIERASVPLGAEETFAFDLHATIEGSNAEKGIVINAANDFIISRLYAEYKVADSPNLQTALEIGTTETCSNVTIHGGFTFIEQLSDASVVIDRVNGLNVEGFRILNPDTSRNKSIRITSNANIGHGKQNWVVANGGIIHEIDTPVSERGNLLPDSDFSTFEDWAVSSFTVSGTRTRESLEGTPKIRFGSEALRFVPASGINQSRVQYELPASYETSLAGRDLTMAAWVYAENYTLPNDPTVVAQPTIGFWDGSTLHIPTPYQIQPDKWTLIRFEFTTPAVMSDAGVWVYGTNGAGITNGSEAFIVDKMYLVEGHGLTVQELTEEVDRYDVVSSTDDGLQRQYGRTSVAAGSTITLSDSSSYSLSSSGIYGIISGGDASRDGDVIRVNVRDPAVLLNSWNSGGNIRLDGSLGTIIPPSGGANVLLWYDHANTQWEELSRVEL